MPSVYLDYVVIKEFGVDALDLDAELVYDLLTILDVEQKYLKTKTT